MLEERKKMISSLHIEQSQEGRKQARKWQKGKVSKEGSFGAVSADSVLDSFQKHDCNQASEGDWTRRWKMQIALSWATTGRGENELDLKEEEKKKD